MTENLKEAFGQIKAEEKLKNQTRDYIFQKTNGYTRTKTAHLKHLIPAAVCMVIFFLGGYRLYFSSAVEISIDINPSVELGVNRFNRVISLEGRNSDGRELAGSIDVKYMEYSDAVEQILETDTVTQLLSDDELMTITVVGTDDSQSSEILSKLQSCTEKEKNISCSYVRREEVQSAHDMGLSYGKYKAFLELQELKPDISADDVQNMTMREIHDLIGRLSDADKIGDTGHKGKTQPRGDKGSAAQRYGKQKKDRD